MKILHLQFEKITYNLLAGPKCIVQHLIAGCNAADATRTAHNWAHTGKAISAAQCGAAGNANYAATTNTIAA